MILYMKNHGVNVTVRLVVIKNNRLLTEYTKENNFFFYIGGHMEHNETMLEACLRETREECGDEVEFKFQKILYIRDFIWPEGDDHCVEIFVLGDINKFEEIDHRFDPEKEPGTHWLTWLSIDNLPDNLLPHPLTQKLLSDYKVGFPKEGEYVGRMDK